MLPPNTVLQDRYRIVRQLGKGGMGAVYEAVDQRLSSIVAIKEALLATDEARRAFEREASLLANLRHHSLPSVTDHFAEGDGQFLVMQFIPGEDLAQLLELRQRAFPAQDVVRWADEILKALEYLHSHNPPILHRDIKPANLKLTREGELFVIDFGLSKGAAGQMPTLLTSRSVKGYTPAYAPLEQIHGGGTDPRSDLYSVGATLYHLLTYVPPVDAPTRFNALDDLQADPMPPADQVNSEVPKALAQVLTQAMAMNRRNRPADAAAMRRMLREAVPLPAEDSVTVRKESPAVKPPATPAAVPVMPPTEAPTTSPTPPTRQTESPHPTTPPVQSPPLVPTIKEVPNLIERPAARVPPPANLSPATAPPRKMSKAVRVLLISVAILLVLGLGSALVPLLTKLSVSQNSASKETNLATNQQQSTLNPSPTPLPSPEFVSVRLRLISEGASGCSVYSDVPVTLTTKNRTFHTVTNKSGVASFSNVPCGDVLRITASQIQVLGGGVLNITRRLNCSSTDVYLGSYGDNDGSLLTEKQANVCYK